MLSPLAPTPLLLVPGLPDLGADAPAACTDKTSYTCTAVYDWTGNSSLGQHRDLADRQATGDPRAAGRGRRRALAAAPARGPGRRPHRHRRPPGSVDQGDRPGRDGTARPAGGDDGLAAQEHRHRGRGGDRGGDGDLRARLRHRPDPGRRRDPRCRDRLRLPDPGQGLPVRDVHDLRGPVRRGRQRRPRRGHRRRRGGQPAGHPGPGDRRHGLVRPQRRDPARRQPEPELGPHRARHPGRLRRGHRAGQAGAARGRRRRCGRTRTSRAR